MADFEKIELVTPQNPMKSAHFYCSRWLTTSIAIGVVTLTPLAGKSEDFIIQNSRTQFQMERDYYCLRDFCYYNPNGLTNKEISFAMLLFLAAYGWCNRHALIRWWQSEIEKLLSPSAATRSQATPIKLKRPQKYIQYGNVDEAAKSVKKSKEFWYVYRNGKSHGPYEKFQLRAFEKISANSQVRRAGESDWKKAGEAEELKDYLS